MKKSNRIMLAIALVFGLSSVSFANISSQSAQQYRSMVSTETVLNYSKVLLERSTVARKLKFSDDPSDQARFNEAVKTLELANEAYTHGDSNEAKKLGTESIRIIARSMPRYYSRLDQHKQASTIAKNEE